MQEDAACQIEAFREISSADDEGRIAGQAPLRSHLAPVRAPPPHMRRASSNRKDVVDLGEPGAAFLTRQLGGFSQVFEQPCDVLAMSRRHIFEIEQLHVIGRGVHLPGEKVCIRWNVDATPCQPLPHLRSFAIPASTRALGFPSFPPQAPQSSADSKGLFSRGAAVGTEEHEPCKVPSIPSCARPSQR